jgi:hypothetical protein
LAVRISTKGNITTFDINKMFNSNNNNTINTPSASNSSNNSVHISHKRLLEEEKAKQNSQIVAAHLQVLELHNKGLSNREIRKETGYAISTISDLVTGKTDPNKTVGRPPALTNLERAHVIDVADSLTKSNVVVKGNDVATVAVAAYSASHPNQPAHHFDSHFLTKSRDLLPAVNTLQRTTMGDPVRVPAMTAENVRDALRSLKVIVNKHWPNGIPLECINNADESDCTPENLIGSGGLVFGEAHTLDKKLGCPIVDNYGKHVSLLAFANGCEGLIHLAFVRGGTPSIAVSIGSDGTKEPHLPNFMVSSLHWNDSGSFKGCKVEEEDVRTGSFGQALKHFEQKSHQYGKSLLLWDGAAIHSGAKHIEIATNNGSHEMVVVKTSAGLTEILQLCDDGAIFGKLKQNLRQEEQSLAASGSTLDMDRFLLKIERICIGTITDASMISALTKRGWVVHDGKAFIDDESIDGLIRQLIAKDLVRHDGNRVMELRSPDYLKELQAIEEIKEQLHEKNLLTTTTTELLKPEVIDATRRAAEIIEARNHRHVQVPQSRIYLSDLKENKQSSVQLTDPEVYQRIKEKELKKQAKLKEEKARKIKKEQNRKEKAKIDEAKQQRSSQLANLLKKDKLDGNDKRCFGRFLTGSKDETWVNDILAKRSEKKMKLEVVNEIKPVPLPVSITASEKTVVVEKVKPIPKKSKIIREDDAYYYYKG